MTDKFAGWQDIVPGKHRTEQAGKALGAVGGVDNFCRIARRLVIDGMPPHEKLENPCPGGVRQVLHPDADESGVFLVARHMVDISVIDGHIGQQSG